MCSGEEMPVRKCPEVAHMEVEGPPSVSEVFSGASECEFNFL